MADVTKTLQQALRSLETDRVRIHKQIAAVKQVLGAVDGQRTSAGSARTPTIRRKRRSMSTAARKAVSVRMKAYWAKRREAASKKGSKKK